MGKFGKKAAEAAAETRESQQEATPLEEQEVQETVEEEAPEGGESRLETGLEEDPLEALRAERDSFREKWLRAVAEMENIRKRSRREVSESRRFAQADILRPLLEVHDNFERALQSLPEEEDTPGAGQFREGVDLIYQKFRSVLKERGVEPIAAQDEEFDPKVHEAVGQLAREGVEAGTVIEVVQSGFVLDGELVLRPARVIVAG